MPGPSKLNESSNIPRGAPNLTRLIFHADAITGLGMASTIGETLALISTLAPVTTFSNETAMLANTTLGVGYMAYVVETNSIYLYQGPNPADINSYILLASGGGGGGSIVYGDFKFDIITTSSDPGAGKLRLNTGTFATATEIYIDALSESASNIGAILANLATGDSIRIQKKDDDDHNTVYKLTAPATDHDGWWTIPVEYVDSTGALFADLDDITAIAIIGGAAAGGATATPGAPDTAVQFNDGGVFGGDGHLRWDKTLKHLLLGGAARIFVFNDSNNFFGLLAGNPSMTAGRVANNGYGAYVLNKLTTGEENAGFGHVALYENTTGQRNVGVGSNALRNNASGSRNVAIGSESGFNATGNDNTFLGTNAGAEITGSNNICIGFLISSLPTRAGNNQLSIQNAIYGVGNAGSVDTPSTGRIGLYVIAPTARLHLPAGQSSANNAPIKMDQGALLSSTELGALEFDNVDGDLWFTTPDGRTNLTGRLRERTAALAGSTLTCDCKNATESRHVYSTLTANATIIFANKGNSQHHYLMMAITGTVALTFESDTRMARYNEVASGDGWNATTKVLTVSSVAAGDIWEFSLIKSGSIYKLSYDGPTRP